ncbi:putative PB1 domain, CBS domain-containing protein [Helianthus annuus]|nr:putative PB1 domain, CBS domain-containing protein [Helianthus annuus]KAJ0748089.1 putative PB1 domain, CBS domain-containing protein [Helianthus annuus]
MCFVQYYSSNDILTRVIAQDLPAESTLVEKILTPNPECATTDTPIVDALHTMHDGKFLHLPVVDRDGFIVSIVDVLHITNAAIATVGNATGGNNEGGSSMMQAFWDSAMALNPIEDEDETRSECSLKLAYESGETGKSLANPSNENPNSFAFKIQDKRGRMHRFICGYEDEDQDKVVISSDHDLTAAVEHARLAGWKVLKLHLDDSGTIHSQHVSRSSARAMEVRQADAWGSAYGAAAAGAAIVAGIGMLVFLRRSGN